MSESQERMCAIVEPANVEAFLAVCARWDVEAVVLGEVNDTGRLTVEWRGETVVDVPPGTVAHDGPVYERPYARPAEQDRLAADGAARLPRPGTRAELRATVLRLAAAPNLCSRSWVTAQYDRYVLGNTVLAMPENAGVLRVDEDSNLGIALSTDGNGRYVRLDPYVGAQLALAEAYRNVAVTGARPLAVSDCLNFGSPEDPGVMWQFAQAVRGLADACLELGVPVTGGNVSFYNQTGDAPILPTPVIAVLGVLSDVTRAVGRRFVDRVGADGASTGDRIVLLGETREELDGSEWAHVVHGHLGGTPPRLDLAAERHLADLLVEAAAQRFLVSAHDLSDGGLAQGLVECCLAGDVGAAVEPPGELEAFVALFAESAARAIVTVRPGDLEQLQAAAVHHGVPATAIGTVGGRMLRLGAGVEISVDELRAAHEATLPAAMA